MSMAHLFITSDHYLLLVILDVDECAIRKPCSHFGTNNVGSYECFCQSSLKLQ